VRSFLDEQCGAGQRHAGGSAGDHSYLAIELSHDHSVELMVIRNRSLRALRTPGRQSAEK
jgi:hypothetical protein